MSTKKNTLKATLAASFCCLGLLQGNAAFAQSSDNAESLSARTQSLEAQVRRLQGQINALKVATKSETASQSTRGISGLNVVADPKHPTLILGTPVISSPYLGVNSQFNASDLLVNQPYVNEDFYLLQQRKQITEYLNKNCIQLPQSPIINLSGKVEAQLIHGDQFGGFRGTSASDIDLSGIELDVEILANEWVTGLMAFVYDNAPPANSFFRVANSNVFLDRGFVTVGDLTKLPIYATLGQFYVPFGQYATAMVTDPFTKTLGRTKERALALGFTKDLTSKDNLALATFIARGPARTSLGNNGLHNFGFDIDNLITFSNWSLDLGASYIRNIADSTGMQNNGNSGTNTFNGFATSTDTEILNPVAGLDGRGVLTVGPVSLTAEYVTALSNFETNALTFNNINAFNEGKLNGAKPSALQLELAYGFQAWERPTAIIVSYNQSKDALALLIPKKRYSAQISTSIWRNTTQSLEFRHDVDYGTSDVATGGNRSLNLDPIYGTGKSGNTVTFQFGLYF